MSDLIRVNDLPIFRFTNHEGQEIGRLWQDGHRLCFDGNASASAQMLFKELKDLMFSHCSLLQMQNDDLHEQLLTLEHDKEQWKNNHHTEVQRARLLKNRTDLPIERKMLYEALRLNAVAEGAAIPLDAMDVVTTPEALDHVLEVYRAAQKLVKCKGRFHSEQNYRALAQLFGVTVPELDPIPGEGVRYLSPEAWEQLNKMLDEPAAPTEALHILINRNPKNFYEK